jgi:hypothetical protein
MKAGRQTTVGGAVVVVAAVVNQGGDFLLEIGLYRCGRSGTKSLFEKSRSLVSIRCHGG